MAVFDRDLISRFEWLRGRPKDEPATLPVYIAFDILELAGRDLRPQKLGERRRVLEWLINHHSIMVQRYSHMSPGHLLKAVESLVPKAFNPTALASN